MWGIEKFLINFLLSPAKGPFRKSNLDNFSIYKCLHTIKKIAVIYLASCLISSVPHGYKILQNQISLIIITISLNCLGKTPPLYQINKRIIITMSIHIRTQRTPGEMPFVFSSQFHCLTKNHNRRDSFSSQKAGCLLMYITWCFLN